MNTDWHDLIQRYVAGTIDDEEARTLQDALKNDDDLADLYLGYMNLDVALEAHAGSRATIHDLLVSPISPLPYEATGAAKWLSWRPLAAAAAGLIIGLFSASVVWGYVGPAAARSISLLQESFESTTPPPLVSGIPVEAGRWSGDYSEIVGEFRGVKPTSGEKMLRFVRADYEGKPMSDGYIGDLFRIIDLRDTAYDVARGDASVSVEARFFSLPQNVPGRGLCGVSVYAMDALPAPSERREFLEMLQNTKTVLGGGSLDSGMAILATAVQSVRQVPTKNWQTVRNELHLPSGARYLLLHLSLLDPRGAQAPQPREFAGLFIDDVRVTLTHRASLQ